MYDNTCKYLAENFTEDIASWLIGSRVTLTELNPTELNVDPIRADSIILLLRSWHKRMSRSRSCELWLLELRRSARGEFKQISRLLHLFWLD
jgi:hypothetical protein